MTFDYDLAIIGSSPAAIYAAKAAALGRARVALVQPESPEMNWLAPSSLYGRAAIHLERLAAADWGGSRDNLGWGDSYRANPTQLPDSSIDSSVDSSLSGLSKLDRLKSIATGVERVLGEESSPAVLASAGIDVIAGTGRFVPKPKLAFEVNNRLLRSRAYLLATGSRPAIFSDIPELNEQDSLLRTEIENFLTRPLSSIPKSLIVIGSDPRGIEFAQTFARQGSSVTLIVPSATLLPAEDPEAAQLILAQLEAEDIEIILNTPVTQIKRIENKKWVQAGNKAIDADEILLATGYQPNIESLNLERVGVELSAPSSDALAIGQHLQVNDKLQTTNPRIYACGEVAGGYPFPHIAEYEASIALKNALFLPIFTVNYSAIPWALFASPQLARVGLSEPQARRRYGEDIMVLRQYFKSVAAAALRGETTGFCKIIARPNGEIVGVHIVGPEATELIHSFALAIQNGLKVGAIASLPHIWPTLSEINRKTAEIWQRDRLRPWQNFLEAFFNWRRG